MYVERVIVAFLGLFMFHSLAKRNRNEYGVTDYMNRMTNITNCPGASVTAFIYDLKLTKYNFQQFISLRIIVTEDVVVSRINLRFNRCRQYEYGCEDFQSWNLTNFCTILKMDNLVMYNMAKTITPSTWISTCPMAKKGIYTMNNLTINARNLLKFYPQAAQYVWKNTGRGYTTKGKLIACVFTYGEKSNPLPADRTPSEGLKQDLIDACKAFGCPQCYMEKLNKLPTAHL